MNLTDNSINRRHGGNRTKGICKHSSQEKPLFTVITVTYNSSPLFEKTILSIINQTYDNIEYIIVDGGSTNGTIDIIEKYSDKIDFWISEPDNGIYDAMNRGVDLSHGDWLLFINSDDALANSSVIEIFAKTIINHSDKDLFYGKVAVLDKDHVIRYMGKRISPKGYWHPSKYICHQGVFFKRELFDRVGKFKTDVPGGISDYIWLVQYFYFGKDKSFFVDEVVSKFQTGGYSEKNIWKAYKSHLSYANRNFPMMIRLRFYVLLPEYVIKFKLLKLHEDTAFRRFYRSIKYKVLSLFSVK